MTSPIRFWRALPLALVLASGAPALAQTPAQAAAMQQDRIEALESQLVQATAENERLQRDLIQAQREIARLQGIVNDLVAVQDATNPAAAQTPNPPPQNPAPQNPAPQRAAAAAPPPPPAAVDPAGAAPAYSRARTLLNNGRLAEAETAFADFLRDYPNADTAPDGRYWYAFTLLARNNYQPAAAGFLDYLQRYQNGPRAPEALVRLGMALGGMEQTDRACAAFRDLPRRYPRASQAVRDLAARESAALSCRAA